MLDDAPHQRQRRHRRGQHQILPRLQPQPDIHGNLREAVELDRVDGGDVGGIGHAAGPVCIGRPE
jgi:hypothetical protein